MLNQHHAVSDSGAGMSAIHHRLHHFAMGRQDPNQFTPTDNNTAKPKGKKRKGKKSSGLQKPQEVVDNTDEVDWHRRRGKRFETINCGRKSNDYTKLLVLLSTGEVDESQVPSEPLIDDRSVSKRAWENSALEWRARVRTLVAPFEL